MSEDKKTYRAYCPAIDQVIEAKDKEEREKQVKAILNPKPKKKTKATSKKSS